MTKGENIAKNTPLVEDLIEHEARDVSRSDRFMKPIAVFLKDQFHLHVHFKLAERRLLHSPNRFLYRFLSRDDTCSERKKRLDR